MWGDKSQLRDEQVMQDFVGVGKKGDVMDAIAVVKTVTWALQYHTIADQILTKQVRRIRDMFNLLDAQLLPALQIQGRRPYEQLGIGQLWINWMNDRAQVARM